MVEEEINFILKMIWSRKFWDAQSIVVQEKSKDLFFKQKMLQEQHGPELLKSSEKDEETGWGRFNSAP